MYISKYNLSKKIGDRYFLCNFLSGAIDRMNGDLRDIGSMPDDLLKYLKERGYILESESEERQKVEKLYKLYLERIKIHTPYVFQIVVTYDCNFKCPYCFQSSYRDKRKRLSIEQADRVFESIEQIVCKDKDNKVRPIISPFGGEPLLPSNMDVLEHIYKKAEQCKYTRGPIITNGYYIKECMDLLKKYKPSGFQITLDGAKDYHDKRRVLVNGKGTFDKIVDGVDAALAEGIKVGLRVNLDQENLGGLRSLAEFIISKGWQYNAGFEAYVVAVTNHVCSDYKLSVREEELLKMFLDKQELCKELGVFKLKEWNSLDYFLSYQQGEIFWPRFHHCESCKGKTFHFDPYGNIYTCIEACGDPSFSVGTYVNGLEWKVDCQKYLDRNLLKMERCKKCCYSMLCGGGCSYYAQLSYNDQNKPFCGRTPELINTYITEHYSKKWKREDGKEKE